MTDLSFTVHCPHCRTKGGQDLDLVGRVDTDWSRRERRLDVACPRCGYEGTVVVELVDGALAGRRRAT